mmetsp:Transcript_33184/g.43722  ORF Transcript_33184/g.43722 Transcript_33184/m.43722 type:complete len:238 (-) Transcript_33184:135-848(-)|eukprot:CAMPEP_0117752776 /NCGR_PEP_ID=MMETSP0947-20121206/11822_1 /TAXON_ID=44440 /ORGANISM="Chattonella subsalsa, Strain CCMP2191" /LENGTH=237 /DNA_ID=CAMNT_0005571513 /DNA_START=171 /DNA_END=884 /DNA_ORIENTATION=+
MAGRKRQQKLKKQTEEITNLMKSSEKKQVRKNVDEKDLPFHIKMQRIEDSVASSTTLTRNEIRWIINMFDFMDTDRDHLITRDEAHQLFEKMGYVPVMPLGTQLTLMQFLLVAGLQKAQLFESNIQGAAHHTFRMMCGKEQGTVTSKMLEVHMKKIGMEISDLSAERIAEIISADGDLEFNETEFVEYIKYNAAYLENMKRQKELQEKEARENMDKSDTDDESSVGSLDMFITHGRR